MNFFDFYSLGQNLERCEVLACLPVFFETTFSLVIKSTQDIEISWKTFLKQLLLSLFFDVERGTKDQNVFFSFLFNFVASQTISFKLFALCISGMRLATIF